MHLPRVKRVHHPQRLTDGTIRIGTVQYGVGAEIPDPTGIIWRLLSLLDGTRTPEAVVDAALADGSELDRDSVHAAIDTLAAAGFLEDAGAAPPDSLSAPELARYASNTRYFAWIDAEARPSPYDAQRRLKDAHVSVLGLGGTGSAVAMSLVAAGVGGLTCLDFDDVEVSNLNRQLLYDEDDVGSPKVATAVRRLQRLNSHVRVNGAELRVSSSDDLVDVMARSNLFVLCADQPNPDIQMWTNEAALQTNTPWSICLYAGPMIVTGIFVPFHTPCYACFWAIHAEGSVDAEGNAPDVLFSTPPGNSVIAPTANLTGHLGALEAIYFLAGLKPQTVGRVLHQNLMIYEHSYYIDPARRPDCPACGGRDRGEARVVAEPAWR
jgi:molybdopterin-synthase adenylyltransferase